MPKEIQIVETDELVMVVHNRNHMEPLFIRISDELEAYVISNQPITDEDLRRSEMQIDDMPKAEFDELNTSDVGFNVKLPALEVEYEPVPAVLLPYIPDQREPSNPTLVHHLHREQSAVQDLWLKEYFLNNVCSAEDDKDAVANVVVSYDVDNYYGNIKVFYKDYAFLFVTFC